MAHILNTTLLLLVCFSDLMAAEVPYGHKNFYPSKEQPLGYRGNGHGNFPGATPVTTWHERTAKGGVPRKSSNIAWRTPTPGWSDTQILPIGDRLIGMAEPDYIFCLDAHTGEILWEDRVLAMELGSAPTNDGPSALTYSQAEAWKRQQVVDMARGISMRAIALGGKRNDAPSDEFKAEGFERIQSLRDSIAELTTNPGILKGFDDYIQSWSSNFPGTSTGKIPAGLFKAIYDEWDIALEQIWLGWVGFAQSTPVTDGEYIYACFGHGPIVCYDLLGNRKWAWRETSFQLKHKLYVHHTPSPVLVDGILFVRNQHGDQMALDPETGRILHQTDVGAAYNHGAYATPGVMRLTSPDGNKKMTILVTQHDKLIEIHSGKIVATFDKKGFKSDIGHGQPRMVLGNTVLIHSSSTVPPDRGPAFVLQVDLANDGTVSTKRVHQFDGMFFGNSPMAMTKYGDLFGHMHLWNFKTGKPYPGSVSPERNKGGGIVIAGDYAFHCIGSRNPKNGWHDGTFGCYDVSQTGTSSEVGGKRYLAWEGPPAEPNSDYYLPELDPAGKPGWFGLRNGGLYPSGNRLFGQTHGYVYAIGDPKETFDWNPASRPAAITQAITAQQKNRKAAGPFIDITSDWFGSRRRAATAFEKLSPAQQSQHSEAIAKGLLTANWQGFQTGATALTKLGPQAQAAIPHLHTAIDQALSQGDGDKTLAGLQTLAAVNPDAIAQHVDPILKKTQKIDALTASDVAIITAVGGLGSQAANALPLLQKALKHSNNTIRHAALQSLALLGESSLPALADVAELLSDTDEQTAIAAARALHLWGKPATQVRPAILAALKQANRQRYFPLVRAALAAGGEEELSKVMRAHLRGKNPGQAVAAARACVVFKDDIIDDYDWTESMVDTLKGLVRKASGQIKFNAVIALGEFGEKAHSAIGILRQEANARSCPGLAIRAMRKIDPTAKTDLTAIGMDDEEEEEDIDLDFDFE